MMCEGERPAGEAPNAPAYGCDKSPDLDVICEQLGRDMLPVLVTDLREMASDEAIDSWIANPANYPSRFGLAPMHLARHWRTRDILVCPRDGSGWVGTTPRTLIGTPLVAYALAIRALRHPLGHFPGGDSPDVCASPR